MESALVPEPGNRCTGLRGPGTRSHEHTNAIKFAWKHITIVRPYPRVRTSPEVGPGATVGTPGLGYPLLLCLGKSLVVILNYVQTAGPLRSGALFTRQRSQTRPRLGKVWEHHVFRKKQALSSNSRRLRTSRGGPDPRGIPDPPLGSRTPGIVTGPLAKGRNRHSASGWSGAATCLQAQTRI